MDCLPKLSHSSKTSVGASLFEALLHSVMIIIGTSHAPDSNEARIDVTSSPVDFSNCPTSDTFLVAIGAICLLIDLVNIATVFYLANQEAEFECRFCKKMNYTNKDGDAL